MAHKLTRRTRGMTDEAFLALDWRDRVYDLPAHGSKLQAVIVNALDIEEPEAQPVFLGTPSVTSDGFLICNFRTRAGEMHFGAFAGSVAHLREEIEALLDEAEADLSEAEMRLLKAALRPWAPWMASRA